MLMNAIKGKLDFLSRSVWQHLLCMGIDSDNIPEHYFCELCDPRYCIRISDSGLTYLNISRLY